MKISFWNTPDKRKSRYQCLHNFCIKTIEKQQHNISEFKKKPNQILIRDGKGNLKYVTKVYYLYNSKDDECDTETEIEDEEWLNEIKSILRRWN